MRTLLIWDRIGDYHAARFQALQRFLGHENCFIADLGPSDNIYGWKNPLADDPHYFCLSTQRVEQKDFKNRFQNFKKIVGQHRIQALGIAGYGRKEYRSMMWYGKLNRIQTVLFAESWYPGNFFFDFLKGWYIRSVADGCMVSGIRAKQHFLHRLKYPENRILTGYSVVDNAHFSQCQTSPLKEKILLCIARFSQEKSLHTLIHAFKASKLSANWRLRLVGGGPEKDNLLAQSHLHDNIELMDWVPYPRLPEIYHSASAFVLPSTFEPWGLVVNEAMAAGLPIIASDACGCMPDLVHNDNGWAFKAGDEKALIQVLNELAQSSSAELEKKGNASLQRIQAYSPDTWAHNFINLCHRQVVKN